MLTQNEFTQYKADYSVYAKSTTTDDYGAEQYTYPQTPTATMHVMWHPVTDEASIAEYGERVRRMKQCVLYEDVDIDTFDRVEISGEAYTVIEIVPYNTHLMVRVEKV